MEQLYVKNFLVIKEATFEVGRVNVIIGSQANGKSLLAKLLYFFREIISDSMLLSVQGREAQKEYVKRIEEVFEKYFPMYTWKEKTFELHYKRDDIDIVISKTSTQRKIQINLCDYHKKLFRNLKSEYNKFLKNEKNEDDFIVDNFWEFKDRYFQKEKDLSLYFNESIFIPASRSFFANLQKNIFSFLSENIDIDPFMKEFGSNYEFSKKIYTNTRFSKSLSENNKSYSKIKEISQIILNGVYRYKEKEDWIESKNGLINLSNASSGQQESLPMLLMLSILPFISSKNQQIYFIEEPEAHLFPVSQKHIVSIFGMLYNHNQDSVITTHSPYILTALNNLILGSDIKLQKGADAIKDIVDEEFCIHYDDVKAYTIQDGVLKSIMDDESRLIGVNIIDSVSDEFNDTFDTLLALQD